MGIDPVAAGLRPAEADLLLHRRGHEQTAGQGTRRSRPPKGLEHHPEADLVVHGHGTGEIPPQWLKTQFEGDAVADSHHALGVGLVLRADVDPEIFHLRHDLPLLLGEQVDRLPRHDAVQRPRRGPDHDPGANELNGIPAPDRLHR